MSLTKEDILGADDLRPFSVEVPEWGGQVWLRPPTGNDRDRYEQVVVDRQAPEEGEPDWSGCRAAFVAMLLCDDQGTLLGFTEMEVEALGQKNGAALDRCFEAAKKAAGMGGAAIEDAVKNLQSGQSESSG